MRKLHWIVLRRLPGPFFGWLGTLVFLLLMQFLIRWLPEIAGKGIPFLVIVELIVYNLAYMLVLAVPMATLLAALMAFASLAETQAYAVIKGAGVSVLQLAWPTMLLGLAVAGGMTYFNNLVLPEANARARILWRDIRTKEPDFELRPGVFYTGVEDYGILVRDRDPASDTLRDVTIYDYTEGTREQATIKAAKGRLRSEAGGAALVFELYDGEMHRPRPGRPGQRDDDRYERLTFGRHTLRLDLEDMVFERSTDRRARASDRTMSTFAILAAVDSMEALARETEAEIYGLLADAATLPKPEPDEPEAPLPEPDDLETTLWDTPIEPVLVGLSEAQQRGVFGQAIRRVRQVQADVRDSRRTLVWRHQRIDRYMVEVYKKFSMALACLVFALIGAPLGLTIGRGGLGVIGGYALGIFLFYWVTLVQGEKLADRGILPPWLGMWIANALMLVVAAWLALYIVLDLGATPPLRSRLGRWVKEKVKDQMPSAK